MRSYRQFCGLARALDLVGERWTLLLVRELLLGPRRYSDLREHLPGITTNLLATRLAHLQDAGLVEKVALPAPARGAAYALTELGASLEPAVLALGAFGAQLLDRPRRGDRLDVGWLMVSLKRRISPTTRRAVVEFRVEPDTRGGKLRVFQWRLGPEPQVREGVLGPADAVVTAPFRELRRLLFRPAAGSRAGASGGVPLRERAGGKRGKAAMRISGDPTALDVFFDALDA